MHLPRIGHSTKGFNWYGTERLIRKHLASRGIHTSMYLYRLSAKDGEMNDVSRRISGFLLTGRQILSQQDTKAHGSSSGNHLCGVSSATPAELTWPQRGERGGTIRPVVPSSEPRGSAQLHGRSPCVFLQPASIREEEASSLSYHISFFLMRRVTAGRAIHAPRPLIY